MNGKINGIIVDGGVYIPKIWDEDIKTIFKCSECALNGLCQNGTPWPCADDYFGRELATYKFSQELTDRLFK